MFKQKNYADLLENELLEVEYNFTKYSIFLERKNDQISRNLFVGIQNQNNETIYEKLKNVK